MKSVCFYFHIHQPFRLKRYRFFDIGNDHYYFDDFSDDDIITRLAENSYMPMCDTLLDMIKSTNGAFKCALSVSGTAIEQLQLYVPEMIDKLKALADTGCVEFLSGTYAHSLSNLEDTEEFMRDVKRHDAMIQDLFGKKPTTFANTELIYDDDIAAEVGRMGFNTCVTVGAKHILGWKSPNYVYQAETAPDLKLLLSNDKLADDVARNFANPEWPAYPLTADKYMDWMAACTRPPTPSEVTAQLKPVGMMSVPYPISDIDEARDVSAWKGNDLQNEALNKLYAVAERVSLCSDRQLKQDWEYLQSSDHFYYMSTKNMADGASHAAFSPYDSPFSAFTNYMNVLADFLVRVEEQYPESIDNEELNSLLLTIRNQASEIASLNKEVKSLRAAQDSEDLPVEQVVPVEKADVEAPAKKPGRKPAAKKATEKKPAAKKAPAKKAAKKAEK